MDQSILNVMQELVVSRGRALDRLVYFPDRSALAVQLLKNEERALGIMNSIIGQRRNPITITFPLSLEGFNDPVPVIPTAEQISSELVPLNSSSVQSCSICQDSISADGCQLRGCQHAYHRACIQLWFGSSVRCPVCRRDIRGDSESQTSSESQ